MLLTSRNPGVQYSLSREIGYTTARCAMKGLLAFFLIVCIVAFGYADRQFEEFVEKHQHLIPDATKERLLRERRQSRHWCCKEDVSKPLNIQRTRIVQATKQGYYMVKTGETNCGTFGWSACSLYSTRTHVVSYTYLTHYDLDVDKACPTHQLVCCSGYVQLSKDGGNNCFALADLDQEQRDLFTQLKGYDGLFGGK